MDKKYFEEEKLEYENINIPEELDFMITKTLKEGREKRKRRIIYKYTSGIVASFLTFVLLVNIFPKVAYAASLIPGIDKLVEFVTFDKGFNNAIDEGLTKNLNYVKEKDGVKLIVNGLAGDYKRLWVDYELIGNDKYDVYIRVIDSITGEEVPVGIGFHYPETGDMKKGYLEIAFQEFVEDFNLEIKVGKRNICDEAVKIGDNLIAQGNEEGDFFERNNIEYITTFNVPITLEKEVFGDVSKEVKLDNSIMETDIGDIKIKEFETSKTRIVMNFNLESEKYDYMGFENPKLVDDKGNEYPKSSFYFSSNEDGENLIEFSGEIKDDIKSLKFICDGMYYVNKDKMSINVDLLKGYVEENPYGIEFISYKDKILTLKSSEIQGLSFEESLKENGDVLVLSQGQSSHCNVDGEVYELLSYLKIYDESLDRLELKIFSVLKDKTKEFEVYLIK